MKTVLYTINMQPLAVKAAFEADQQQPVVNPGGAALARGFKNALSQLA